ncbi:LysR family transcriptional regulator [Aliamphritea ceti]|uniref:LysR family transcriptional regulator n=1 Tax=Aliamphritea ceti TaxID=1524258 RepID=UPI0021C3A566|nr:LysR family transcriptional regulator [Aliamphritea ceti]
MPSQDQILAFIAAAEQGSFSAAARRLNKAQSAVSHAIQNLEIDIGVELFDRSSRSPTLTPAGNALLRKAHALQQTQQEFIAHATSLNGANETEICLAIAQSVWDLPLLDVLKEFEQRYPYVTLELLDPGSSDAAELIRSGRADIGLMMEQEIYPKGFRFSGIGHARLLPVCHPEHPLVLQQPVSHQQLREHRQLLASNRNPDDRSHERHLLSPDMWRFESPHVMLEAVCAGLGWAFLHESVIREKRHLGELTVFQLAYQQVDVFQGIDVIWTEHKALGTAGQWLLNRLRAIKGNTPSPG